MEVSQSPFARLGRMEEEEEEGEEGVWILDLDKEVPEPPAPLGPGLGRTTFKRGSGERMPRVRKWSKPNKKLFFAGEWGICNDNCDCHRGGVSIQTVEE